MSDTRGVRFIRKNGRIIPIRLTKHEQRADAAVKNTSRAALGAFAATAVQFSAQKQMTAKQIKFSVQKHGALWASTGYANVFRAKILGGTANLTKNFAVVGRGGNEAVLLHELGHLSAARKSGSANNLLKRATARFGGTKLGKAALAVIRPFASLATEAEATSIAVRSAAKVGGFKKGVKIAATLALPYATYATTAGLLGSWAYALGAGIAGERGRRK